MRPSRGPGLGLAVVLSMAATSWGLESPGSRVIHEEPAPHEGHAASGDEHAAHRAALEKPRYAVSTARYTVPEVDLVDESGEKVSLRGLLEGDRPVALNFIFTTCTTICPVMTATFAQMRRELGDSGSQVRMVSISIDPEYDRPAVLKDYAGRYDAGAGWTFLTGDGPEVTRVLQAFQAYAGSKMNHRPLTLLKSPQDPAWVRIDGLASGEDLAHEVHARLLD